MLTQSSFELSHNRENTVQIETFLGGMKAYPGDENRRFIGCWPVVIFSKQNLSTKYRNRHLFLFSDYAIFAKPKGPNVPTPTGEGFIPPSTQPGKQLWRVKEAVKLDQINVKDDKPIAGSYSSTEATTTATTTTTAATLQHTSAFARAQGLLNRQRASHFSQAQNESSFTLTSPQVSCVVRMKTPAEKVTVISHVETLTQQFQNDVQVFGVDLPSLLFRENRLNQVPIVVDMLTTYIKTKI